MTRSRVSGAQLVYQSLRQRIGSLELAPGTRLHEVELAASLSVSRTPVREALRLLLAEGLVRELPTGGVVVAPLDPDEMRQLYVVRSALEGVAAREACARVTDADLTALDALVDQMSRLLDYPAEMLRLGQAFHARLLEVAGNPHLEQLLHRLRGHLERYQSVTATIDPRRSVAYAEHREILEAVRAGAAEEAERLMRSHVMAAYVEGAPLTGPPSAPSPGGGPSPRPA